MFILRCLLALFAVGVICPAVVVFVNIVVLWCFRPTNANLFLFFCVDEYAIPGLIASLLVGIYFVRGIMRPQA